MPGRSVQLKFEVTRFKDDGSPMKCEGAVYISPNKARKLLKEKAATVDSQRPFVLRLKAEVGTAAFAIQMWTPVSDGRVMSGAVLERNPPRL